MLGFIFVIGFLTLFFLGWQGVVLLSLSIGGLCYFIKSKRKVKLLYCLALGGVWAIITICWRDYLRLDDSVLNQAVVITGNVISIPEHHARKVRFLFLIDSINHQPLWPARQVRLNWYRFKQKKQQILKAGELWQFQVKLRAPSGLENFIGFNYRRWLYQHSIQATGVVINRYGKKDINRKLSSSHAFNLQQYRQKIAWFLERIDLHNAALIKALVLGERAEVKPSVRNLLQQTGTAHLLAVSGLHIGLIVTFTFFLIRGILLWAPGMSRKNKNSGYALFIAAMVSLLIAVCYIVRWLVFQWRHCALA
ncbi:ComEC/Rec2 family competence protein [Piscirickettsia salmonis]|uniref:ComEC/Rec2 family competence protein n=1 Tax=Piscirickettsia salmonis TaxID=1238 RepID=UPI0007C8D844|nr:ComEC family competence protein [Piscirickettsiaceae bacterium NZ-RLO1]